MPEPAPEIGGSDVSIHSDGRLAMQAAAGHAPAFGELVNRHSGGLLRFLLRYCGNLHDAEDLLQDTFVRAYEHIGSYDANYKFTTWMFTIAWRLACSHHRKGRTVRINEEPAQPLDRSCPLGHAMKAEQKDNLWNTARQVLPENQFMALWLKYAEDISVQEIARILDRRPGNVKVLLFRAREGLYDKLKGDEDGKLSAGRRHAGAVAGGA
ncbi:MAG: sigma-70 family RNA polymerase sigma factor [Planctomycetes bacterium]|nr:sigma-70 family RNA polymerase sigma factor [Planctomycetota bacterium]